VPDERRIEKDGRIWTVVKLTREEAEQRDVELWQRMTPDERVQSLANGLLSASKTRGVIELPRLRRVHRRIGRSSRRCR
jgi:hypothetical protein